MTDVITRFAPSPTGMLHIGSARTALFNYLFAKHNNGKFLLRIEDTDKVRSTQEACAAIFSGLKWLGLNWDGEVIFQSKRSELYRQAALQLLEINQAYYCFTPQEEIDRQRDTAIKNKQHFIFRSPWRNAEPSSYPQDVTPVVRLKVNHEGETVVHDTSQGDVVVDNSHLDDMILLRSDNTATYMLAVVVDDHDMGITHIIRGDDHLANAARQILIYKAFNWQVPSMTHIPLIHGSDGAKLSKRHGALGIEAYRDMGYLPEALCNYLLRLGWGHGDDEIIDLQQAIKWFELKGLGKSPARLDFHKMNHINAHYLRKVNDEALVDMIVKILQAKYCVTSKDMDNIKKALPTLKTRSETLVQLSQLATIYLLQHPIHYSEEVRKIIANCNVDILQQVITALDSLDDFTQGLIQAQFKEIAAKNNIKLSELIPPIRALITGMVTSPGIFEIMQIIGKEHSIARLCEGKLGGKD